MYVKVQFTRYGARPQRQPHILRDPAIHSIALSLEETMRDKQSSLETDFQVFESHRKEWFHEHGEKHVVIHNGEVLGLFYDYTAALRSGVAKFGAESEFLIQQVCIEEPVFVIY